MSLSKDILDKNTDKIYRRISVGIAVNDHDAYGYTPLILAIMTNQPNIVDLLLSKGADVNMPDLFGQPPLHWAIRVESEQITSLLLKKGAFPNTVSAYGEPLLVYPLIKKQSKIAENLRAHGTSQSCAEDYIFLKNIGHHFDLKGFGLFKNYNLLIYPIDYQGFRIEFSLNHLKNSYESAVFSGKYTSPYQKNILETLARSCKLRSFKQQIGSHSENLDLESALDEMNLFPMAFDGHAVSVIYSYPYLILCDRSQGREHTAALYSIPHRLSLETIKHWLYGKKNRLYWDNLPKYCEAKYIDSCRIDAQISGNCSWANIEPSVIFLDALYHYRDHGTAFSSWKERYENWSFWNKNYALNQAFSLSTQLSGDRLLALKVTLLNIILEGNAPHSLEEKIKEYLSNEKAMIDELKIAHEINHTVWCKNFRKFSSSFLLR